MKSITLLLCVVAAASATDFYDIVREEWLAFKLEYNKSYASEVEETFRMKIFAENKLSIAKHNQRYQQHLVSYECGLNKFSDILPQEVINTLNGYNKTASKGRVLCAATFIAPAHVTFPDQIDWREKGAVTDIKDQLQCGSCWAFSTTGSLEGQHFRKTGTLVSLSEQNLVDCSQSYDNNGCNGGLMDNAFKYIKENGGIDTESSYPYEGVENKCRYDANNSGANDVGFVDVSQGDEEKLMQAVATVGPVSVAIDASRPTFTKYSGGVYYDENCSTTNLDHAVLVVGYGTDAQHGNYWLVKNSWGASWGEQGYIRMARNKNNHCGIANEASYPLV